VVHLPANDSPNFLGILIPFVLFLHDPSGEIVIRIEVQIPEGEVFQFRFHPVDTKPIGKRGVEFQSLLGDIDLPIRRLEFQGSHIVDAVR